MFSRPFSDAPGTIKSWAGASVPAGWLNCDGAAISRSTYAALFATVGTAYGVGDGSTTFNVPDRRGRVIVGAGTGSGLSARSRGQSGGAETHPLTGSENGAHSHTTAYEPGSLSAGSSGVLGSNSAPSSIGTSGSGSGAAHPNMQPWGCDLIIIKF